MRILSLSVCVAVSCLAAAPASVAQLAPPNDTGVRLGHIHLVVPDVARHSEIWTRLGGEETSSGGLRLFRFPGVYIALTEGQSAAPSSDTSINHIGFSVRDYARYKATLAAVNAQFIFDNEKDGQIIADLPDGVRIELLREADQQAPIAFHHVHLAAADVGALRDWYLETLGAEAGERRGLPSAIVPGGRIDVLGAKGATPRPSRGAAIDHLGFEVADIDAFAARLTRLGRAIERAPARADTAGLRSVFLTDPVGGYVEITQGLGAIAR